MSATVTWDTLQPATDTLERLQAETAAELEALLTALLDRAFAGKLVPANPADKPAEKLLARIQNIKQGNL
jgi:type I restriction enzyme, S subunit